MKSKWKLIAAIFQLMIGILGIASFFILRMTEENMIKWIGAFILSIACVGLGIIRIREYKKD